MVYLNMNQMEITSQHCLDMLYRDNLAVINCRNDKF